MACISSFPSGWNWFDVFSRFLRYSTRYILCAKRKLCMHDDTKICIVFTLTIAQVVLNVLKVWPTQWEWCKSLRCSCHKVLDNRTFRLARQNSL